MRSCTSIPLAIALALATAVSQPAGAARADGPERREVPDYDSRPDPETDAVDVLLWVPRIVTGPLYLISEYLIRVPLGALITAIEQNDVVQVLLSFFTFGPERNVGVFVTAFYDFGFLPSVGLYAFWRDFLAEGNRISLHGATWGVDWLSLTIADRVDLSDETRLFVRGAYVRRPDYLTGTGVLFEGDEVDGVGRYASESVVGELGYELHPDPRSIVAASAFGRWAIFSPTDFGDQPSVDEFQSAFGQDLPRSFTSGYAYLSLRARAAYDSRDPSGVPSAGFRISGRGEVAAGIWGLESSRWFLVGGQLLGATDFLGGRRVFALSIEGSAILPVSGSEVPFDQTIDIGGQGPLQGFLPGHLRGGSAVAATLAYEWPVWLFLNARLYATVGAPFGFGFEGFALEKLRLSFGIALRPPQPGEHPFELGIGVGTDTFEDGASVSAFRFFVGARNDL